MEAQRGKASSLDHTAHIWNTEMFRSMPMLTELRSGSPERLSELPKNTQLLGGKTESSATWL